LYHNCVPLVVMAFEHTGRNRATIKICSTFKHINNFSHRN